jgi:putative transposase
MHSNNYTHSSHNVSGLYYHIVICTKYRLSTITPQVEGVLRTGFALDSIIHGYWIDEVGFDQNHCHILLHALPRLSVTQIVTFLKSNSARLVNRVLFPDKLKGTVKPFWSSGYFAKSVGMDASSVKVKDYIKNQGVSHIVYS